jgi:adenosylmethionine-8-amino-7-oxononanoate aminotransferase
MQHNSEQSFVIDEHLEYPVENIRNPVITTLSERDAKVIWHPFTQHYTAPFSIPITRAEGAYLFDENGKRYIDAIASWWVNLHGHAHPYIAQKVAEQFLKLEQVIFAGFTHEPAVRLAEQLLEVLPPNQGKIFYSDNGSTAVEVALKMALQYFHNQGIRRKTKIIALENGYHGDTFGTMAVGSKSAFTAPFDPFLFEVIYLPVPTKGTETATIKAMQALMEQAEDIAAFIFEPLIQGAGGMVMYEADVLETLLKMAQQNDIITIADEIMTGFYRTGKMFATDYLTVKPDIFCLSKGLTGGAMALGATACTNKIYDAFLSDDRKKTLFHSHSFTANPLACTAGIASLSLLLNQETQDKIQKINHLHQEFIKTISNSIGNSITEIRLKGTILAIELKTAEGTSYFSNIRDIAYNFFLEKGILMRPLGNVIYLLTPYCISEEDLAYLYATIQAFLAQYESGRL